MWFDASGVRGVVDQHKTSPVISKDGRSRAAAAEHFAFDAAGEIGRIGGIAGCSFFNDDQVPAHFSHRIFFNSLSTTLNSRSPVTNSAFVSFANAAAKQSA